MISVSELFNFYKQNSHFQIDRRDIYSYNFSLLRRNLRTIIKNLDEGDENAQDISRYLRKTLSQWLTVPIPFDKSIEQSISEIGNPETIGVKWGHDIKIAYQDSLSYAKELTLGENPMRLEILNVFNELKDSESEFKIFCHKRARPFFETITNDSIDFISSIKEYRQTTTFNTLIKIGPFRSHGWGSSPDGLLTAPRFEKIVQLVWSGCWDEPGFGFEPVTDTAVVGNANLNTSTSAKTVSWVSTLKQSGDYQIETQYPTIDDDEFHMFQTLEKYREKRSAILVQIDDQHGVLYPSRARIPSFDPSASEDNQFDRRLIAETLTDGMFLVIPNLDDTDSEGFRAKTGDYSKIWKQCLDQELDKDQEGFCDKLLNGGVNLLSIRSRVKEWCKPITTVIPAPQKIEHFKILVDTLNIPTELRSFDQKNGVYWWQYAWREIQRSRGEAIIEGRFEQEANDEKVDAILTKLQSQVATQAKITDDFYIEIPLEENLFGHFRFLKVISIESGFSTPDSELRKINDLEDFEQWRV